MEFHQLEQFMAIARNDSMREAAQTLCLSQPTLSQNLKKLEGELGCPLFDRSHNRLQLTTYGKILLEHCEHMVDDWRGALDALAAEKRRLASTVRVGCYSTVHSFFLMPQLSLAFPELNIEAWVREVPEIVSGFKEGDFDIVIVPEDSLSSGLDLSVIDEERAYLSLPHTSPLAAKDEITFEDLRHVQLFVPIDICGLSPWYRRIVREAGVDDRRVEYVSSSEYLSKLDMTMKCHFSTTLMQRLTSSGSNRVDLPIADDRAFRTVCMASQGKSAAVRRTAEFIRRQKNTTYSGHAFLPIVLKRANVDNLIVHD